MKNLIPVLMLSVLTFGVADAQKVSIKNGVVKVNGARFCKTDCKGLFIQNCKILSLNDEALAEITFHTLPDEPDNTAIVEIRFINTAFLSEIDYNAQIRINFKYREQIIRELYRYKAIQFGQLDEFGVKNFVKAYSEDLLQRKTLTEEEQKEEMKYQIVQRNTSKPIFVGEKTIEQDFKPIGTYAHKAVTSEGETKQQFSFYLMDGTLVATATVDALAQNGVGVITTIRDNESWYLTIRARFMTEQVVAIAKELSKKGYL